MKQNDVAVIIGVGLLSAIVSIILAGKIITTPANRQQQVEVVQPISTQFSKPDPKYFNSAAIDPTKVIHISSNSNNTPFNSPTGQ
jgi:hypothetical protein